MCPIGLTTIPAIRLPNAADFVKMVQHGLPPLQDGGARQGRHTGGDDAQRLPGGMRFDRGKHAQNLHGGILPLISGTLTRNLIRDLLTFYTRCAAPLHSAVHGDLR